MSASDHRRRAAPRARLASRLATLGVASIVALLAAACGDGAAEPSPRATLRVTGPASVVGTLTTPPGTPELMRYECAYEVQLTSGRTPLRADGIRLTLQPRTGGDLAIADEQTFSAEEVAEWLGGSELGAHMTRHLSLQTWYTFAPTADEYGRTGSHRARWAFAYDGRDTTTYEVECTPAMGRLAVAIVEGRLHRYLDGIALELNGAPLVTRFGHVMLPDAVVAGRYPIRLVHPRYAPVDSTISTHGLSSTLRLTRVAPMAEYAGGGTMVDPPTGGWVSVHHPDGVAHLPASLRLTLVDARTTPARRVEVDAVGTDVEATLRRYAFVEDASGVSRIEFTVPWDGHPDVALYCGRSLGGGGWACGDG